MMTRLQMVFRHGRPVREYRCPTCSAWSVIDDDQFHGRASMYHDGCDFHETIDLASATARHDRKWDEALVA